MSDHHVHHVEHHKPVLTEAELRKKKPGTGRILGSFFLDMLPVIFGILIAVGINSWRERKHDRKIERFYLANIKKNLDANIKDLEFDVGYFTKINEAQKFFSDSAVAHRDSLAKYYSYFFYVIQPSLSNTAFLTLQNTGKLDIISNLTIIEDLTSLYEVNIPTLKFFLDDYTYKYNSLFLPYLISKDPKERVYTLSNERVKYLASGDLGAIISSFQLSAIVGNYKKIIELHKKLSASIAEELDN